LEKTVVEAFGQAVRSLRTEKGLTQEKLALLSGIQRKHLGAIELGRKQPSLVTVSKLAHGLCMSASELVAYMETHLRER
jgi:transcriptional regulator with XRE-family HTH domain